MIFDAYVDRSRANKNYILVPKGENYLLQRKFLTDSKKLYLLSSVKSHGTFCVVLGFTQIRKAM